MLCPALLASYCCCFLAGSVIRCCHLPSSAPAGGPLLLVSVAWPLTTSMPGYRTADKNRVQRQDTVSHAILYDQAQLAELFDQPAKLCVLPTGTPAPARACQVSWYHTLLLLCRCEMT